MITPKIAMVAWEERNPGDNVFVAVPNERGRYVRTDRSVALVPCQICGAQVGEPCLRSGTSGSVNARYGMGTHWQRRKDAPRGMKPDDVLGKWMPDPIPNEHMEHEA